MAKQRRSDSKIEIALGAALTLANSVLLKARIRKPKDGWRRGAGLMLRSPESRFYLSSFGLNHGCTPDNESAIQHEIGKKLLAFLQKEPDAKWNVHPSEDEDIPAPHTAANATISFEPWLDGPGRFVRPEQFGRVESYDRSTLLQFVCRIGPQKAVDVWVQANHVGMDGLPLQEILNRLAKQWGSAQEVQFSDADAFSPMSQPRMCGDDGKTWEIQQAIDFAPLLAWRAEKNRTLRHSLTMAAALMWRLTEHPHFANKFIGCTAEVAATRHYRRGVGVIALCPAQFRKRADGLDRFAEAFNQQMALTRARRSRGCKLLDAAAHLPPRTALALLASGIRQGKSAFGSFGITMLKDAAVFGAPMGDPPHTDGFMAIGNISLPTPVGRRIGWVTIKGTKEMIAKYPALLQAAIDNSVHKGDTRTA